MSIPTSEKKLYKTQQQTLILDIIKEFDIEHFTVTQLRKKLESKNLSVGTTTIYRQLGNFINQGLINKYVIDEKSPACFQYVGSQTSCNHSKCVHLKCDGCNELIHIDDSEIQTLTKSLQKNSGFNIDFHRTVFYGKCKKCSIK